jgi:glucose-6-phosphate 1-dehydrogenase
MPASSRHAPPATITIFGAAGDLTKRLVMPALYNLARREVRTDFSITGVDISDETNESWRNSLTEMMHVFGRWSRCNR